eukprot:CAMPEP_0174923554 /NCGR_PEP_ID=MMETSP1355-20121228/6672_1 /TAXON_ID=464990 /ORGANISM="Hemiselmis tepida, Strain CCMP443" /LENGTH=68 /DNA_ID=CAMNT_0016169263 /DNA_START=36 /DNA_END=238 /DNA_ORIENTATION=+
MGSDESGAYSSWSPPGCSPPASARLGDTWAMSALSCSTDLSSSREALSCALSSLLNESSALFPPATLP